MMGRLQRGFGAFVAVGAVATAAAMAGMVLEPDRASYEAGIVPEASVPTKRTAPKATGSVSNPAIAVVPRSMQPSSWMAPQIPHYPYDGRFTFVRIRYASGMRGGRGGRGGGPSWAHDYPRAEINFLKILDETTNLASIMEGGNVFSFDDPELTKFPIAYMVEVGAWTPSEAEVDGLRNYLLKGGFLIIDDFRSNWELYNFQEHMRRVLPGHQVRELDIEHPVFNSFFHIESLDLAPPTFRGYDPMYLGIFEDDKVDGRLMVMINFNNDIGDYWEYSDVGWYPIDLSNDAFKLGVNYIMYAYTH